MKFQLVILSALLVSAIALPVPDEEVSPVVQTVAEIKPEVVEAKNPEVIKPELRNVDEVKSLPEPLAKPVEDIKIELPANAPDAELPQLLPEIKKDELKEEKKPELLAEKQIRSDNVAEETKALPVVVAPVNAAGLSEEPKQVVDEAKPAVQEILPEGKSAATVETKKEEILAIEAKPEIKVEELKPLLVVEEKKEELPARQERTTVEQAAENSEVLLAAVPDVAPAESVVAPAPAVKDLVIEGAISAGNPEAAATKLSETAEKVEEPLALASEEKPKEDLKLVEAKKIDEALTEVIKPAEAAATEIKANKPEEPEKLAETQLLKKQEELKSSEEQKSNESKKAVESKESEESKESKESGESKEDNKSN